jgi:hypothetical protein
MGQAAFFEQQSPVSVAPHDPKKMSVSIFAIDSPSMRGFRARDNLPQ